MRMDSATQQGREGIGHLAINNQTLDGEVRKEHVEKERENKVATRTAKLKSSLTGMVEGNQNLIQQKYLQQSIKRTVS